MSNWITRKKLDLSNKFSLASKKLKALHRSSSSVNKVILYSYIGILVLISSAYLSHPLSCSLALSYSSPSHLSPSLLLPSSPSLASSCPSPSSFSPSPTHSLSWFSLSLSLSLSLSPPSFSISHSLSHSHSLSAVIIGRRWVTNTLVGSSL